MSKRDDSQKRYFELAEHNSVQLAIFMLTAIACTMAVFLLLMPVFENIFIDFLNGKVDYRGEPISYYANTKQPLRTTSYFFSWAVDINFNNDDPARYWFSPPLSLLLPAGLTGILLSIIFTAIIPEKIGLIRRKIEREIINQLERIAVRKYGSDTGVELKELTDHLAGSDIRDLHAMAGELRLSFDDLKVIARAIRWKQSSLLYRIIHFNHGVSIYMRFYFTTKYTNAVLGFVYIGAAILIIIIGLRGLKFIPPTQPSLVLFALGLEFCLLITYAFTLMYSRQEDEVQVEEYAESKPDENMFIKTELGEHGEVEKLLRVFIKSRN